MAGDGGGEAMDYSVHEAWNEATNVYLLAVLASLALLVYARRNKRKIMRIFTLPPAIEVPSEPNFYDSVKKIRLRQQLEMYSIDSAYSLSKNFSLGPLTLGHTLQEPLLLSTFH